MPVKLIAMDMDGTLLDSAHTIPLANLDALREAADRGIHLALCSGRMPDDAGFFAVDAKLPMHVLALNGTCILDGPLGNITYNQYMDEGEVRRILAILDKEDVDVGMFGQHELVISTKKLTKAQIAKSWGTHVLRKGGRSVVRLGNQGREELIKKGVNKLVVIAARHPEILPDLRRAIAACAPGTEISSSWAHNLELNANTANKGTALRALAAQLNIDMAEVMALGDNDNDIPMLTAAGYGVVMKNGTPATVASAKYMTLSHVDAGVAAAIRHFAFGEHVPGVVAL